MAGNVKRAIGIAVQSAQGTPATVPVWLRYIEKRDYNANIEYDTAEYERYVRWMAGDALIKTKHLSATLDGTVDSREFPRLLCGFANYSVASTTHTFDFALAGLKFLTIWFADGLTGEMWRAIDCRGDKLKLTFDYTAGTIKFNAQLLGLDLTRITSSLPTVSYSVYTHRDPTQAWQTPITRNGSAAFCPIMGTLDLDNNLSMLYCAPTADPSGGTVPGLAPTEIQEGKASGTWAVTARYLGLTGTPYEDFQTNVDAAYTIKSTRPEETTPHTLLWTLPRFRGTKGHFDTDPAKVNLRQEISGTLLLDDTTGTGAKLVVFNDQTDYTA